MHEVFSNLVRIFQSMDPPGRMRFQPPAAIQDIEAAQEQLGLTFPADLRELLLCVDGQEMLNLAETGQTYSEPLFPQLRFREGDLETTPSTWLAGVESIVEMTEALQEQYLDFADDGPFELIGPACYHDQMLSFTNTEDAANLCLDLKPHPDGTVGQVVMVSTQPCQVVVLAASLRQFLHQIIEGFHTNRFHPEINPFYRVWKE